MNTVRKQKTTARAPWAPAEAEGTAPTRRVLRWPSRQALALAFLAPLCFAVSFVSASLTTKAFTDDDVSPRPLATLNTPRTSALNTPRTPATPSVTVGSGELTAASSYAPDESGPGLTGPGVLVQAVVSANGDLEVVERVVLSQAIESLTLAPPVSRGLNDRNRPRRPEVTALQVSGDGQVLDAPAQLSSTTSIAIAGGGAKSIEMRYRLTGAVVRSVPSTPGRALVLLPPITTKAAVGSLPVIIEVVSSDVNNMSCPALASAKQLCGRASEDRWYTVPLVAGSTAVVAQVNLPAPGG